MNKGQMLKQVVERAVKNGWRGGKSSTYSEDEIVAIYVKKYEYDTIPCILFWHDFAKEYFGEDKIEIKPDWAVDGAYLMHNKQVVTTKTREIVVSWQYHLQQAVLSEDPLIYYFERL